VDRTRQWLAVTVAVALALPAATASAQTGPRSIVSLETLGGDGVSGRIALDLAQLYDDGAARRLLPILGVGALQNVLDLATIKSIDLAIVQQDALDAARRQQIDPGIGALTYVARLYDEDFHLVARSSVASLAALAGKTVDFGPAGGGAAVTGPALFAALGVAVVAAHDPAPVALARLERGEVDAMALVAAPPLPLLAALDRPSPLRLVAVPPAASYAPAQLEAEDYPALMPQGGTVDTVAVGMVLAAADLAPGSERAADVASFVDAFFARAASLREPGHAPQWREVDLAAELPGWQRAPAAAAWLEANAPAAAQGPASELKAAFDRFLDERMNKSGAALTQAQKDALFAQFRHWQEGPPR
jgi:uncharacterized protein